MWRSPGLSKSTDADVSVTRSDSFPFMAFVTEQKRFFIMSRNLVQIDLVVDYPVPSRIKCFGNPTFTESLGPHKAPDRLLVSRFG